jgi:hypothetical protein
MELRLQTRRPDGSLSRWSSNGAALFPELVSVFEDPLCTVIRIIYKDGSSVIVEKDESRG